MQYKGAKEANETEPRAIRKLLNYTNKFLIVEYYMLASQQVGLKHSVVPAYSKRKARLFHFTGHGHCLVLIL